MINLFFKLYTYLYVYYLKIFYPKRIDIKGRIKAKRFFRIEVSKNAKLIINGNITVKENVLIAVRKGAKLQIGNEVFFNRNCSIVTKDYIEIGDDCMFGENVKIYDHDHKIENFTISKDTYTTAPINIAKNCWIANDVNILKGSIIPENTVIAAMSLVNKPLEKSGLYAGIPVKFKKPIK